MDIHGNSSEKCLCLHMSLHDYKDGSTMIFTAALFVAATQ